MVSAYFIAGVVGFSLPMILPDVINFCLKKKRVWLFVLGLMVKFLVLLGVAAPALLSRGQIPLSEGFDPETAAAMIVAACFSLIDLIVLLVRSKRQDAPTEQPAPTEGTQNR